MILFVTRKYPPSVGGMQRLAADLHRELAARVPVHAIVWGGAQRWLPVVLPWMLFRILVRLVRGGVDAIYFGDALAASLILPIRLCSRVRAVATVHGLDVVFRFPGYRTFIRRVLGRLDAVVCVSRAAASACRALGIPADRLSVIPNAVDMDAFARADRLPDHPVIAGVRDDRAAGVATFLTSGRLVERKGVHWFIEAVLPRLEERGIRWRYHVVGDGPARPLVEAAVRRKGYGDRVRIHGRVDEALLRALYRAVDVFVMPNQAIPGTMEGFGLVAVEATAAGVPVVATDLEGIADALADGVAGVLVPARAPEVYAERIAALLALPGGTRAQGACFAREARRRFGWAAAAWRYVEVLRTHRKYPSTDRKEIPCSPSLVNSPSS